MKKSLLLIGLIMSLFLSGCVKLYTDVKSDKYATLQMRTEGGPFYWNDGYRIVIYDYSKGCKDMVALGLIHTNTTSPSRIVKLPVETPLLLKVNFYDNRGRNQYIDYTNVVLIPERNKHYIVEYLKETVNDKMHTEYNIYMKKGKKAYKIPSKRMREFNNRECM